MQSPGPIIISPVIDERRWTTLKRKVSQRLPTINGLWTQLNGVRHQNWEQDGESGLYISPESLRSVTIERLLLKRKIARFVIDEGTTSPPGDRISGSRLPVHCDFIKNLQEKRVLTIIILVSILLLQTKSLRINPISEKNWIQRVFVANASRTNLHYSVYQKDNEEEKYNQLRSIIETRNRPTIVYVSRTKEPINLPKD